jgi:hypothetical protein
LRVIDFLNAYRDSVDSPLAGFAFVYFEISKVYKIRAVLRYNVEAWRIFSSRVVAVIVTG